MIDKSDDESFSVYAARKERELMQKMNRRAPVYECARAMSDSIDAHILAKYTTDRPKQEG